MPAGVIFELIAIRFKVANGEVVRTARYSSFSLTD